MNEYFGYVYEPQAYLFKQYKNKQYILIKSLEHYIDRNILKIWLNNDNKTEYSGIEFKVIDKHTDINKYNLYIRPETNFNTEKTLEEIAPLFCKFLKVMTDYNEKAYEYLINWTSCLIQTGLTKQAIILMGDKGIGKGTFGELFGLLVGTDYYRFLNDINHIGSKFNADKEKTILCAIVHDIQSRFLSQYLPDMNKDFSEAVLKLADQIKFMIYKAAAHIPFYMIVRFREATMPIFLIIATLTLASLLKQKPLESQ